MEVNEEKLVREIDPNTISEKQKPENIIISSEIMERILNVLGEAPARVAGALYQDILNNMRAVDSIVETEPEPEPKTEESEVVE